MARYRVSVDFGNTNPEYENERPYEMTEAFVWHGIDLAEARRIFDSVRCLPYVIDASLDEWVGQSPITGEWHGVLSCHAMNQLDGWETVQRLDDLDADTIAELHDCLVKGWHGAAISALNGLGYDIAQTATLRWTAQHLAQTDKLDQIDTLVIQYKEP